MSRISFSAYGSSAGGKYAEFKLLADGKVIGQAVTTSASRIYSFDVALDPAKPHSLAIRYENDATIAGADRNLFVSGLQVDGRNLPLSGDGARYLVSSGGTETVRPFSGAMPWNGSLVVDLPAAGGAARAPAPPAGSSGRLELTVTGDHWNGAPQFLTLVDGKQVGGVQTTTASRANGNWQEIAVSGDFAAKPAKVEVKFINDATGGAGKDRNLYVDAIEIGGTRYEGETASNPASAGAKHPAAAVMAVNGTLTFSLGGPTTAPSSTNASVSSSTSRVLSSSEQNLVLTGSGSVDGTGNALANRLTGNTAANVLDGRAGNDALDGAGGNDRLIGGAGNDRVEGGGGQDVAVFTGRAADYRIATSNGTTTVVALNGNDGTDTLTGVEKLSLTDKAIDLASSPTPAPGGDGNNITRHDGTFTFRTSRDGQVIEDLDIRSGGTGIEILHKNVTVRDVRVQHADGDGIIAHNANNLRLENVQVVNTDPPAGRNPEESDSFNNIEIVRSPDVVIRNVTVEDGSTGIYLLLSPRAKLDHVDGYDFHGPFPRGQFVQFNQSPDGTLTNFYAHNNATRSHVEDIVNVNASRNVRIENGVIDGNNSRSGVAVMFEDGSNDGLARNVDVIRQANGAFSAYSPGVDFIDVRAFDSINHDQGRGHPSSNGVQFNIAATGVRFDDATYTRPGNPGNIVWETVDAALLDIKADPNAVPMSHAPYANDWDW